MVGELLRGVMIEVIPSIETDEENRKESEELRGLSSDCCETIQDDAGTNYLMD